MDGWKIVVSGSVKDFNTDYHFAIQQALGAGMPPVDNINTDYGLLDGALFQRTKTNVRTFTLAGVLSGSSVAGLHADRKELIDVVKPDRTSPQEPVVIQYTGAGSTLQASAFYDAGLELADVEVYREKLGLRFTMFDSFFEKTTSTSVALTPMTTVANANYIIQRSPCGVWSSLGVGANSSVLDLVYDNDNYLYAAGVFTSIGGVAACMVARWNGSSWSALGSGPQSACAVQTLAIDAAGDLYAGGLSGGSVLTKWNGSSWSSIANTYEEGMSVRSLNIGPDGTVYIGGTFHNLGGVTACSIAKYSGGSISSLNASPNSFVHCITTGTDGRLYVGGAFSTLNGSTVRFIAQYVNSTWLPMGEGFQDEIRALKVGADGALYVSGDFEYTGQGGSPIVAASTVARWNGSQWGSMASGMGGDAGFAVMSLELDEQNNLWCGGNSSIKRAGGITLPEGLAIWNGTGWVYPSLDLPGNAEILAIAHNSGSLILGGLFSGTASTAAVTTVTNSGTANAYPIISIKASAEARLFDIANFTTGEVIYFNLTLNAGETATLDLRPGKKTFISSFRGNVISTILPGSTLTTWHLASGSNAISMFIKDAAASAALEYTERFWSIDGGA